MSRIRIKSSREISGMIKFENSSSPWLESRSSGLRKLGEAEAKIKLKLIFQRMNIR